MDDQRPNDQLTKTGDRVYWCRTGFKLQTKTTSKHQFWSTGLGTFLELSTCTATYHHLKCFACLLLHGAKPDLNDLEKLGLPPYVQTQCSVPHAIIKYRLEKLCDLARFSTISLYYT
jgi:hypothetical protein